ncbi:hypothetical protein HYFRA_00004699 [Hymenoscyphus fraxineus]|uniref:SAP domain-containing protein n=1 Tax=Hymenoscyphus fraxineus TaxID=746836 RepID=A0A9N9KWJ7_9HELO|nr:hypothetical protein HYFRA_00004699 [Hymenoscyphus fraxineus]
MDRRKKEAGKKPAAGTSSDSDDEIVQIPKPAAGWTSLTVKKLAEQCKVRSMKQTGRKASLVERLDDWEGDFTGLTVRELQEKCKKRGFYAKGTKKELIERLATSVKEMKELAKDMAVLWGKDPKAKGKGKRKKPYRDSGYEDFPDEDLRKELARLRIPVAVDTEHAVLVRDVTEYLEVKYKKMSEVELRALLNRADLYFSQFSTREMLIERLFVGARAVFEAEEKWNPAPPPLPPPKEPAVKGGTKGTKDGKGAGGGKAKGGGKDGRGIDEDSDEERKKKKKGKTASPATDDDAVKSAPVDYSTYDTLTFQELKRECFRLDISTEGLHADLVKRINAHLAEKYDLMSQYELRMELVGIGLPVQGSKFDLMARLFENAKLVIMEVEGNDDGISIDTFGDGEDYGEAGGEESKGDDEQKKPRKRSRSTESDDDEIKDEEAINKMNVDQLKAELKERGELVGGTRAVLLDRLINTKWTAKNPKPKRRKGMDVYTKYQPHLEPGSYAVQDHYWVERDPRSRGPQYDLVYRGPKTPAAVMNPQTSKGPRGWIWKYARGDRVPPTLEVAPDMKRQPRKPSPGTYSAPWGWKWTDTDGRYTPELVKDARIELKRGEYDYSKRRRCNGVTKSGSPCSRMVNPPNRFCKTHHNQGRLPRQKKKKK